MLKLRLLSLMAIFAGVVLGVGTLTFQQQAEAAPEDDIEAMLQAARAAWNAGDVDTFLTYFTDEGLADQFDTTRAEAPEAVAETMEFTGDLISISVSNLFVTGGNARGIVDAEFEAGFSFYEEWQFVFLDGGWKIGEAKTLARPIPAGVPVVPVALQEYAFVYDKAATASGNFAFLATNVGEETHEIVLFGLSGNESLLDLLTAGDPESEDIPAGLELLGFGGFMDPGEQGSLILEEPLSPGRYGLVCFLPSPDGTPHFLLGMASEFTVGTGAAPAPGITPPSTGDAGLLEGGSGALTGLVLGVALVFVLGGTAGLAKSRMASRA